MSASKLKTVLLALAVVALASFSVACQGGSSGGGESSGGTAEAAEASGEAGLTDIDNGGITEVSTDAALVKKGEELFKAKTCNACHAMGNKMVGPALGGVTERREAAWIAQMILHPDEMIKKDPVAKKLFEEYGSPMTTPPVSPEEADAIIAYLGTQK